MRLSVVASVDLDAATRRAIHRLCDAAFGEDLESFFAEVQPCTHVLGHDGRMLIAHALYTDRELRTPERAYRTAYVEAFAVNPKRQGRGLGRAMLDALPPLLDGFDLAALSPADEVFYARSGWQRWTGPLAFRSRMGRIVATPGVDVMVLPLGDTRVDVSQPLQCEWRRGDVW